MVIALRTYYSFIPFNSIITTTVKRTVGRLSVLLLRKDGTMDKVFSAIYEKAKKGYDIEAIRDGLGWLVEHYDRESCEALRVICAKALKGGKSEGYFELYKLGLLIAAPYEFDCYMQYLEIDRKAEERFYLPRRGQMVAYVNALQELAEGTLRELFVSMPPRVGKSTLAIMFMSWLMGRNPEYANLYCSYSDVITKKFYDGVLEIITDAHTYNYAKIFPQSPLVRTNAQDETIDLERRKHYPSMTARSIYGTLNGACDVTSRKPDGTLGGILIADDLVSGIEEAMSKDRLISLWAKVDNNMITRAKEASILWIGTRWSVIDPAGIRMEILENDNEFKNHSWRAINIPALNEKDESNFDFKYGVGLSTTLLRQRRASFERNGDVASWLAQYMGEPIERDNAIFSSDEMMYYNGTLPDKEPDRVFMAVDPAWGGGDYVSAPIIYQFGTELYVADCVYDNSDKSKTIPKICRKAREHNISAMYVEASKTTAAYPEEIDKMLKSEGRRVNIQRSMKNAIGKNKNDRILAAAPEIREHMIFLESGRRSKEYEQFMQNIFSFKVIGKNKNDDAPDSLQMAISFAFPKINTKITVSKRSF